MMERGGPSQALGEALRVQVHQMFHWWHRVRDGTLAHASFASHMRPIRRTVERLLEAGQRCGVPKMEGTCRDILKRRQDWWTFVRHAGVEPTNNAVERAMRPGVLWRKGSFGTHSPEGCRFVEAMMTVVATLTQQHRHVLDYVTATCEAALQGNPAPSLLPPLITSMTSCVPPPNSVAEVNGYHDCSLTPLILPLVSALGPPAAVSGSRWPILSGNPLNQQRTYISSGARQLNRL
jgi:transposase